MKKQFVKYLILSIAIFGLSIGSVACSQNGNADEVGKVIRLKIGKMTCGGCATAVKIALQKVDHVVKAEVSFDTKIAQVYIEKDKSVNVDDLIKAVEKSGYTAKLIN